MLTKTLSLILIICIIDVSAQPRQAVNSQDQIGALAYQAIAQSETLSASTTTKPVSELIVKIPGSPEASAAASAIAGHPVKVVKVIKKVLSSSAKDPISASIPIYNHGVASVATQATNPNLSESTKTVGAPTTTATTITPAINDVRPETAGGNAFDQAANTIINNDAVNAISAAAIPNSGSSRDGAAAPEIDSGLTINPESAITPTRLSNALSVDLSSTPTEAGLVNSLDNGTSAAVTATIGAGTDIETPSPMPSATTNSLDGAIASSPIVAGDAAAAASAATTEVPLTTAPSSTRTPYSQDGQSRGALSRLFGEGEEVTTPKPKAGGVAAFLDGFKKRFFGDGDKEKDDNKDKKKGSSKDEKKKKEKGEEKKDDKGDEDDKNGDKEKHNDKGKEKGDEKGKDQKDKKEEGDDGSSRGGDIATSLSALLTKRLLHQVVHLAINSAGGLLNKTAHGAAKMTNAGIEQSALLATKLNNLEAELPAKAFEKLAQIDCKVNKETLSGYCLKPDAKKRGDSEKNDKNKSDKDKKKEEKKDTSSDELPELALGEDNGAYSKSSGHDETTKKSEDRNDLIVNKDEIQKVDAEKTLEVENLKAKLHSEENSLQTNNEEDWRTSNPALAIKTLKHPNVAVSLPEKSEKSDSVTLTEPVKTTTTTTTIGKSTSGSDIQITSLINPANITSTKLGERIGLNNAHPPAPALPSRVQTIQTTTSAIRPTNLLESFGDVVRSIVPPAIPNYKTVETKTVNAASG